MKTTSFGRTTEKGISPKYYDMDLVIETLKNPELKRIKVERFKRTEGSNRPIVVISGDVQVLTEFENVYADLLARRNSHLTYEELKAIMPSTLKNDEISDRNP